MIVKIWPIRAHYPKNKKLVGGMKGVKNALAYITDAEKVIVKQQDLNLMKIFDEDTFAEAQSAWRQGGQRVFNYIANEDKIEGKYISGYRCRPEQAVDQFAFARECALQKAGIARDKETGALAFHMVQSFPEELDISNEEVHQCGLELCEKIRAHQAVVCSHVHPAIDEKDGTVHGKNKHNHILFNAYIHPDDLAVGSKRLKYHDCKETYAQLQVWNDEIAVEHGLPIIRNPDDGRVYSWTETDTINKGRSWKERIRLDIETARRASDNWNDFVAIMEQKGYKVRDGVHVSYTAPDGVKKARGSKLGREYTKQSLELYWSVRSYGYRAMEAAVKDNESPALVDVVLGAKDQLNAAVPLGLKGSLRRQYYHLPLDKVEHKKEVLETYFNRDELYDICDENNRPVAAATGQEILECMELLRDGKMRDQQKQNDENRKECMKQEKEEQKDYYIYALFQNSRTKKPYRTSLFDDTGRRRTNLELIFLLAMTVIRSESAFWDIKTPPGRENDPIFGTRDWKIQNMVDSIHVAREENIETPAQLEERLDKAGASLSRAKSALKATARAKEKMEPLNLAVFEYRETSDIAERIFAMEEGPEKEEMKALYADAMVRYKTAKATLYRYRVKEENDISEFKERYAMINEDIQELQERLDTAKEEYRRLKKLSYHMALAQNAQYCYGPACTNEHTLTDQEVRN